MIPSLNYVDLTCSFSYCCASTSDMVPFLLSRRSLREFSLSDAILILLIGTIISYSSMEYAN